MGTSHAKVMKPMKTFFKYGDNIQLILDQANWFEGEIVTGSLVFNVSDECPPIDVSVVLEGFEFVKWHHE